MNTGKSAFRILGTLAVVLMLAACAGKTVVESDLHIKGAPDWVNEGTNILKTRGGRLFHGVGSSPAMGDMSLQTSSADDRARAELARILTSYMDVVSQDYVGSATAGGEAVTEQSVSREIENVTRLNLTGARIIGRWRDTRTNVIYALAELDLRHVKDTVKSVETMNTGLRAYIGQQSDNIFDKLVEERRK